MILSSSFHGTTFAFQTKCGPFFQVVHPICWPRHGLVFRTTTCVGREVEERRRRRMECVGHFSFQGLVPWFPLFPHACAWVHFGVGAVFGWVAMVVAVGWGSTLATITRYFSNFL